MKRALIHTVPAIAATLILAVQPVAAQDRSGEYEQGYNDAMCDMFRDFAPIFVIFAPMIVADNPEVSMADFMDRAEECGIDWTAGASETASDPADPEPTPEPAESARCERLAALIAPLDAEIDRLLAAPTDSGTSLAITQSRIRRSDINSEMRGAGC